MPITLERILTTTDLSRASYAAVRRASHLAKLHKASATLLHIIPQGMLHDLQRWLNELDLINPEKIRSNAQMRLREWVERIYLESGVRLDPVVLEGTPTQEIVKQANARKTTLIVIGAHGEHVLLDLFVGSRVALRCADLQRQVDVHGSPSAVNRDIAHQLSPSINEDHARWATLGFSYPTMAQSMLGMRWILRSARSRWRRMQISS